MDDLARLIDRLRAEGVSLWAEGQRLRWRGPEAALGPERIEVLAAREAEIVAALRRPRSPIPKRDPAAPIPLAFMQERMFWRCDRLDHARDIRLGAFALEIAGPLDAGALGAALAQVVERHEVLRTRIDRRGGSPQVFLDPVERHALAVAAAGGGEIEAIQQAFLDEKAAWGAEAPLFAAKLLALGEECHRLLLGWHHVIYDAIAIQTVVRDLFKAYAGLVRGQPVQLPAQAIQFPDVAAWQRGPGFDRQEAFWTETLRGAAPLAPPQDAAGVEANLRGDHAFTLTPQTAQAMRALSQQNRTFLPLVGAAATALALGEWSGTDDLVMPFQYFGRDRPELETMVGCLAYPLHLRVRLREGEPFADLLARIASEYWAVCRHADYGRIAMERGEFLDSLHFNWLGGGAVAVDLPDLGLKAGLAPVMQSHMRLASIHMSVLFFDDGQTIRGALSYRADLFSKPAVERLGGRMVDILESLA